MRSRAINLLALAAGGVLMFFALCCSFVNLTHGNYNSAVLTALGLSVSAVLCLSWPFYRGPLSDRVVATVLALPALFVWLDFAQRFWF